MGEFPHLLFDYGASKNTFIGCPKVSLFVYRTDLIPVIVVVVIPLIIIVFFIIIVFIVFIPLIIIVVIVIKRSGTRIIIPASLS